MIVEDMVYPFSTRRTLSTMRAALGSAKIFEMVGGRQGDVGRGDADDRPVEIPEGFIGDN